MFAPTVEDIEELHEEQIQLFGGSSGLRDRGLLESAVARPENMEYYRPEATVGELAATLGWGLIKNHAFIDGNKRVGLNAVVILLGLNDYELTCTEDEQAATVQQVAASELTEAEWTAWVVAHSAPL